MSELSVAPNGFTKRASRIISNAALYQLVQDMAETLDGQKHAIAEIHEMCTRILTKLSLDA